MDDFLMKPKIDFAFKEIMRNEQARIGFLSAFLKLNPAEIRKTEILNTDLRKLHEDEKQGILDVRIMMNNDTEIDIEIQLSALNVWADRALFYLSKMFTEQIRAGQNYNVFKKCVSISILDFDLFKENPGFYSCFHIREDTHGFLYTDKMEFHVIELPKLPKSLGTQDGDILLWAKFINAEQKEDFDMLAQKNTYIDDAYQQLKVISQDKEKQLEYEAREKAIRDYNQMMYEANVLGREQGYQEGKAKGLAEGKAEGLAEGKAEGLAEGKAEGLAEGLKKAITALISDHLEYGIPREKTLEKLQLHFGLTAGQAEQSYSDLTKAMN